MYLVGFHSLKEYPDRQMEAHHYCHQQTEDFAQCVLFDSNSHDANMNGIEHIISDRLFATLPWRERRYWHPLDGDILSGQLVAPGIPEAAEHALTKKKMNSYGKTWHVWDTGHSGAPGDTLQLGDPMLAWSFNRDGETLPGLIEARDRGMKIDTGDKRRRRQDLQPLAAPRSGIDALRGQFGRPTADLPGVTDETGSAATTEPAAP